jgi:hypothetical protein
VVVVVVVVDTGSGSGAVSEWLRFAGVSRISFFCCVVVPCRYLFF